MGHVTELLVSDELVEPVVSKHDWDNSPYCGFETAISVLVDQGQAHQTQKSPGQSASESILTPGTTPGTDVALKKPERFLKVKVAGDDCSRN